MNGLLELLLPASLVLLVEGRRVVACFHWLVLGTFLVGVLATASFQFDLASLNFLSQTWTEIINEWQVNKLALILPNSVILKSTYIVNGAVISFSCAYASVPTLLGALCAGFL